MPLVAYKNLPTFERLRKEGRTVLSPERALKQDIRELHIGLLNMMPDAALQATERQFFRLIGESNQIVQLYMHPFTLPELERGEDVKSYIHQYYEPFEKLKEHGLDALIVTGANVSHPNLKNEPFWEPLQAVLDWAWENVTSTLCSCLATHAVMQFRYHQKREALRAGKLWGVYKHRVTDRTHPLVRNMNTVFDVPHSRYNQISTEQFEHAGMRILVRSENAGTHLAVSPDGFRLVCLQGHPEYDTISLLKEYQRERNLYEVRARPDKPPLPENYFRPDSLDNLDEWLFDEMADIESQIENTWTDSARSLLASWTGLIYQTTHPDRKRQFMDGINPENPLSGL